MLSATLEVCFSNEERERRESWCLTRRQAAIGLAVVGLLGNPSLCPAFRIRRGSGREYGLMTGRARRATRPTPEQISASSGDGADFSNRPVGWGITRRPLLPAVSRLAAPRAVEGANRLRRR